MGCLCSKTPTRDAEDSDEVGPDVKLLTKTPNTETIEDQWKNSTKFVFIGDANSGKTSIIKGIQGDRFNSSEVSTIGVDFKIIYATIGGESYKLILWDTPGQERFSRIATDFYRGTDCFVIVYDLSNKSSGRNVKKWLEKIEKQLDSRAQKPYRIMVGNKLDLDKRKLDPNYLAAVLEDVDHYVETSAATGLNLEQLLKRMAIVAENRHQQ